MSLSHVADALKDERQNTGRTSELSPARRKLVIELAPVAPPCFADRLAWLEYLCDAQIAANGHTRGPLDLRKTPTTFNHRLDFCGDCTARFARQMQQQGRCNPNHLLDLSGQESQGRTE